MSSKYIGTWKLDSSENFDEYMKAVGKWRHHSCTLCGAGLICGHNIRRRLYCSLRLQIHNLLSTVQTPLTVCMCPVEPVCRQLTCHRRLFSLSRTRNRRFIALLTPIDFTKLWTKATPTSQRTLFTCLWYA